MENKLEYSIYKNKVYLEVIYKGVPMNSKVVYKGKNKKDCNRWIQEEGNKKYVKKN